ncbi:hypothetical protein RN001_003421 [Aquatica leii]|uniref:Gem-associated protein 5 n=1 Tax=Aquatica leii TaxID=1421715 RepID=A0AAN7QBP1_9COLE|nr:hypothetical protein RN001_003421 [Aquatica leii]
MNKLIVSPSPNWFSNSILACAPDNTVIYGSRNELIIINPTPAEEPADLRILGGIHSARVISVKVNRNWGNPNKWAVSVGEDNVVQLLDISTYTSKISHVGHKTHSDKIVGAEFAGEDRVISVSEKGFIIIWKLSTSSLSSINTIKDANVKVSTISICPHASWLIAVGTKRGGILIADLKKSGRVVFRIRAHDEEIITLSWCPAPHNVFPKKIVTSRDTKNNEVQNEEEHTDMCNEVSLPDIVPQTESCTLNSELLESNLELAVSDNTCIIESVEVQDETKEVLIEIENKPANDFKSDSSTETLTEDKNENAVINIDVNNIESKEEDIGNLHEEQLCEELETTNEKTEDICENTLNDVDTVVTKHQPIKEEFLLASSSRGCRSIKIWRAGTDGLLETELFFPKPYSSRSKGGERYWITICWVTPRSLLSSANKAQLLHWRLGDDGNNRQRDCKPRLIHSDHTKQLFCIAAPTRKHECADDEDWRDKNLLNAWTTGSDRFILNTSLGCDHKTLGCYTTIGGTITCLIPSPIDPTRIACGMGDGNSRLIDLSRPHLQTLSMTPLYEKSQIKITSFAWHPKKEACLAYGTQEGQVGLIDTASTVKNITELVPAGHHALYSLQWAPLNGDPNNFAVYTISSSKLMAYDVKKPLNAPTEININNGVGLTSFAWKHDYSILAIATKNCELFLFDSSLKLLAKFLLQSKTVRCMEWHPPGSAEENWLALSTNQIIVYDCTLSNLEAENKYEDCAVAVFTEHQGYVHTISWSPHQSEILASAGDFGMAMVWNVKTKTLLHACISQFDVLYGVVWSPLDSDYIITGGRGCVLRIWKLSENPPTYKIDKPQQKQTLSFEKSKASEEMPVVKDESKQKRTSKWLLNGISQLHNLNVHTDMLQDCIKLFNSKRSKDDAYEDCKQNHNENSSVFNILQLFEGKDKIDEILKLECENRANRTTPLCLESISLWQGNIGDTIKNAIMCESLNHWLVSVAPMVSFNLWQEACEAYAKQLLNENNNKPIEAAYYFLACHKVEEAIEALCFGSYYREALILAKSRLSTTDPIIENILKRWASYSASVGKYEIAAQCYIVLNMMEDAAKVLFRRKDIPILEFCVKLAKEAGNEELLNATLFRLNALKAGGSSPDDLLLPLQTRAELELEKANTNYALEKQSLESESLSNEVVLIDNVDISTEVD